MSGISKAVVTGGAGFIGSHIVDELLRRHVETIVIDNLSTGSLENLKQHEGNDLLRVIVGDAWMVDRLLADVHGIDAFFHEAAIASVPRSVAEPMAVHEVNVDMSLRVMNFCVSKKVKRFVFASSAAVYGVLGNRTASEELVCLPSSPYGASKMCVENYLTAYHTTYGLEPVMLRYFNVYGPRQAFSDYSGVITIFINRILEEKPLTIFGDGGQVRDFVNVKDIVRANMLAIDSDDGVGSAFNVASGRTTSILQLVDILKKVTGANQLATNFAPPRPGDVRFGIASIDKIKTQLHYTPSITMEDGLSELVDSMTKPGEINVLQQ